MEENDYYDNNVKREPNLNCIVKSEIEDTPNIDIMPPSIIIKEDNYDINVKYNADNMREELTEESNIKHLPKLSDQLRAECSSLDIKTELYEDEVTEEVVIKHLPNSGPYQVKEKCAIRCMKKERYNHIKQIFLCKYCEKFYTITTYFEGPQISLKWKQRSRCPICNKVLKLM